MKSNKGLALSERSESKGFSLVEVLLSAAIFMIFATGATIAVVSGFNANRLGGEETVATQYATEGIEAMRSIKNQGFSNLVNTSPTTGVRRNTSSGIWEYNAAANNTFDSGRYTRTLTVSDVCRDAGGNIDTCPGASLDANAKKVVSKVSWNFTSARPLDVSLASYLTNWKAPITPGDNGLLVYGEVGNTTPRWRTFTDSSNSFSPEANTLAGTVGRNMVVRTSPTKREAVVGYTNNTGNLYVLCFDGTSWSSEWSVSVGGTGTTRRFDIAYETNSGDSVVLYSTGNSTSNELAYRTKPGTAGCGSANWTTAVNYTAAQTNGQIHWVKMAWDRRTSSNLVAALWADSSSDLSAAIWDGGSLVNEPTSVLESSLEVVSAAQDVDDFDIEYESSSADVLVVWANSAGSNGTNGVRYSTCTGGTANCSWSGTLTPPTWSDDATNLDVSANPTVTSNEIVFASIGNAGSDLQVGYWSGSGWTNFANTDTSAQSPLAGTHLVATGWLSSGSVNRAIVVYNDNNATVVSYRHLSPSNTWTPANGSAPLTFSPAPLFARPQKWYDLQMDPTNSDRLLFTLSDNAADLFAKRLVMSAGPSFAWSNADSGVALETALGQSTAGPFSFGYWRNP